jgi:hypothetical protein
VKSFTIYIFLSSIIGVIKSRRMRRTTVNLILKLSNYLNFHRGPHLCYFAEVLEFVDILQRFITYNWGSFPGGKAAGE